MITSNDYIQWYKNEKRKMLDSGIYKSEPTFLFKPLEYDPTEWIFNPDNWNGGDILRHFLYDNFYELTQITSFEIKPYIYEDQTTIFIFTAKNWYEISWYKSRGRTDIIKMNGDPIYLEDYIDLCNALNITIK